MTHAFKVSFTHAPKTRQASLNVGWLPIRPPKTQQPLWLFVAYEAAIDRTTVLLTNLPLTQVTHPRAIYDDWRSRDGYRFDQEQGLDVEDMRLQSLEAMNRLFFLVLAAAQFFFFLIDTWPQKAVLWIRQPGGKLSLAYDLDGPYLVLRGLSALLQTRATLSFLAISPLLPT